MYPELYYYDIGPGVTAFSSTRRGGFGSGQYGAFNINCYCGDSEESVRKNRAALCSLLGIADERLLMPHQVHLTQTAVIDEDFMTLPPSERRQRLEGVDALMTDMSGLCIGVSTADCIPLLLFDRSRRAVCAIHAGWRGTLRRIAERAVGQMTAAYGTRPADIIAQIGPGISLDSFEVGDEVYEAFRSENFPMELISRKQPSDGGSWRWHIDLPECNRRQLLATGIPDSQITLSNVCTYKQADTFFSARRLGILSGRIFTGILLHEDK